MKDLREQKQSLDEKIKQKQTEMTSLEEQHALNKISPEDYKEKKDLIEADLKVLSQQSKALEDEAYKRATISKDAEGKPLTWAQALDIREANLKSDSAILEPYAKRSVRSLFVQIKKDRDRKIEARKKVMDLKGKQLTPEEREKSNKEISDLNTGMFEKLNNCKTAPTKLRDELLTGNLKSAYEFIPAVLKGMAKDVGKKIKETASRNIINKVVNPFINNIVNPFVNIKRKWKGQPKVEDREDVAVDRDIQDAVIDWRNYRNFHRLSLEKTKDTMDKNNEKIKEIHANIAKLNEDNRTLRAEGDPKMQAENKILIDICESNINALKAERVALIAKNVEIAKEKDDHASKIAWTSRPESALQFMSLDDASTDLQGNLEKMWGHWPQDKRTAAEALASKQDPKQQAYDKDYYPKELVEGCKEFISQKTSFQSFRDLATSDLADHEKTLSAKNSQKDALDKEIDTLAKVQPSSEENTQNLAAKRKEVNGLNDEIKTLNEVREGDRTRIEHWNEELEKLKPHEVKLKNLSNEISAAIDEEHSFQQKFESKGELEKKEKMQRAQLDKLGEELTGINIKWEKAKKDYEDTPEDKKDEALIRKMDEIKQARDAKRAEWQLAFAELGDTKNALGNLNAAALERSREEDRERAVRALNDYVKTDMGLILQEALKKAEPPAEPGAKIAEIELLAAEDLEALDVEIQDAQAQEVKRGAEIEMQPELEPAPAPAVMPQTPAAAPARRVAAVVPSAPSPPLPPRPEPAPFGAVSEEPRLRSASQLAADFEQLRKNQAPVAGSKVLQPYYEAFRKASNQAIQQQEALVGITRTAERPSAKSPSAR
jgi:hypothetical protein